MKIRFARRIFVGLLAGGLASAPLAAEEKRPKSEGDSKPAASRLSVYVPPSRGAAGARTGGGTRSRADAPRIAVLAPDHVGLTTRSQPVLAWYLSGATDARVEFTLIADGAAEPLVETALEGPLEAGIQRVELAALGAELDEGETYDWSVALVLDPGARDSDVVAGGAIERRAPSPDLAAALAGPEPAFRALAAHGVWYDAIADLSAAIAASPEDAALRAERAALLEQVGVAAAAGHDRRWSDARAATD